MKKVGLIYSMETEKTSQIAKKIAKEFAEGELDEVNLVEAWGDDFRRYDNLILGTATWFDGELPDHWSEIIPKVKTIDFKGKKVAIYGLGDQKHYPDNFVDGIGLLANVLEHLGAKIVGYTSTEGYTFNESKSLKGDQFCGLALDFENQAKLNKERVKNWVEQLKKEFD